MNPRPAAYKAAALTTELPGHYHCKLYKINCIINKICGYMGKEFSEQDLINLFRKDFGYNKSDDIGIINFDDASYAFNIDTFVKSTDAPSSMDYRCIGWKSILSSISDLYIKRVEPIGILISLGISQEDLPFLDNLKAGIHDIVEKHQLEVVKWDTNSSEDMFVSVCSFGKVMHPIPWRSKMKKGDYIVVSDYFGLEGLGLKIMMKSIKNIDENISKIALSRFCMPNPDFKKYKKLFKRKVNASIDSSDGLARSLWLLSEASNLKIKLFNTPLHPIINEIPYPYSFKIELALYSGEEYIGVFSIPESNLTYAKEIGFIPIGRVLDEGTGVYDSKGNLIKNKGWIHTF